MNIIKEISKDQYAFLNPELLSLSGQQIHTASTGKT